MGPGESCLLSSNTPAQYVQMEIVIQVTPPEASQQKGGGSYTHSGHKGDTEDSAKSWRENEISGERESQPTEETEKATP